MKTPAMLCAEKMASNIKKKQVLFDNAEALFNCCKITKAWIDSLPEANKPDLDSWYLYLEETINKCEVIS